MSVEAVHHILRVTDIERAIRFYRDGLGFEVVERPAEWWANLACPSAQLAAHLCRVPLPGPVQAARARSGHWIGPPATAFTPLAPASSPCHVHIYEPLRLLGSRQPDMGDVD